MYRPGRDNVADPISRNPGLIKMPTVCAVVTRAKAKVEKAKAGSTGGIVAPPVTNPLHLKCIELYEHDGWFQVPMNTANLQLHPSGLWLSGEAVVVPNS